MELNMQFKPFFFCYIFSVICLDFVFILQSKRREKLSGWNKKEDLRFIYQGENE